MVFSIWMDETGVLIFKAFDKNPRFDQLLPGQGILYSYESFFFVGGWGVRGKGFPIIQGSHCKFMYIYK